MSSEYEKVWYYLDLLCDKLEIYNEFPIEPCEPEELEDYADDDGIITDLGASDSIILAELDEPLVPISYEDGYTFLTVKDAIQAMREEIIRLEDLEILEDLTKENN